MLLVALTSIAADAPRPVADPANLGIPYQRYTTTDALGRTITFYLSVPMGPNPTAKRPVVLFVGGSGCQSAFRKQGEHIAGGYQNLVLQEAKGRVRVLIVEKPGVKFLDAPNHPGSAEAASEEYLKEHTLPRWAEANKAALRAVWTLPDIDSKRTLVVGHSEGGIVAARVAAELPEVTHAASLAGGGPTQLFDLAASRGQARPGDEPGDAQRRMERVYDEFQEILADPESIARFWLGHPYRRWSSFLKESVVSELLRTKAHIYLAHGTLDTTIPAVAHDVLVAELRSRGCDVTAERIDGADHGFRPKDAPPGPPVEMQALLGRVLEWFLDDKEKRK
jgi:dienelactone hydrolase